MLGMNFGPHSRRYVAVALMGAAVWTIATGDAHCADEPDAPITWEGTWNNRKYNTSGPLRCTAERKQDGSYEALFEGTFMGSPFDYKIPVKATRQGNQTLLEGAPTIDGDPYEWTGAVRGRILSGQFRSAKGNNGEFRLQETSAAKKP